jgi:hypothetical protein
MWEWIDETIALFRPCFTRKAAFGWFAVTLVGLMLRGDHLGVTSIVRELNLNDGAYTALLHFFKSDAWYFEDILLKWVDIVKSSPYAVKESGRFILIGDGVKQAKEGRRMPGVWKLHQESDNSGKGMYIHGHHFGGLGLLAGNGLKECCVLLSVRLHDGVAAIQEWLEIDRYNNEDSHVVKMIRDAAKAVKRLGESILLLDRLYLTRPMLEALASVPELSVVTKAKSNATAYFPPGPYKGRGARPKKGPTVKVASFFAKYAESFKQTEIELYGKKTPVSYFCIDLLWGMGLYRELRFVLTVINGTESILVSTDLSLAPEQIVKLYGKRFKIECAFRENKQVVAGFSYHFWSKVMPKLHKFKKNTVNHENLKKITDERHRGLIMRTVRAIEMFVQVSAIALGILQFISLGFHGDINGGANHFMRTKSNAVPSERTVADYFRKNLYVLFMFFPKLDITAIISKRQTRHYEGNHERAA